jgi:hypothetical protein
MNRHCGSCNLCCSLLPVRSLGKKDGQRCKHQSHARGCKVHADLGRVSPECRLWNCRWLVNDAGDTKRPDRSHAVIDIMPDYIKARDDVTGEIDEILVVQIWIDPRYPDAHKDPALREWLDRNQEIALVRYSAENAIILFPPSRNREWMVKSSINCESAHTPEDLFRVLLGENA